jgi:hypothetical protein
VSYAVTYNSGIPTIVSNSQAPPSASVDQNGPGPSSSAFVNQNGPAPSSTPFLVPEISTTVPIIPAPISSAFVDPGEPEGGGGGIPGGRRAV